MKWNRKSGVLLILSCMVFCIPLLTSCRRDISIDSEEKELFLQNDDIGFYRNGNPVFVYRESFHQKAENPDRGAFRFQTDVQDTCLNATYTSEPRNVGVHVSIYMDYIEPMDRINAEYQFECSKINGSVIWFWNPETKSGIILPCRQ